MCCLGEAVLSICVAEDAQIATTLASVRRVRPEAIVEELDSPADAAVFAQSSECMLPVHSLY